MGEGEEAVNISHCSGRHFTIPPEQRASIFRRSGFSLSLFSLQPCFSPPTSDNFYFLYLWSRMTGGVTGPNPTLFPVFRVVWTMTHMISPHPPPHPLGYLRSGVVCFQFSLYVLHGPVWFFWVWVLGRLGKNHSSSGQGKKNIQCTFTSWSLA